MKQRLDHAWNRISRLGLREGEDVTQFREVILLNRLMVIMFIVMGIYLPMEVILFGWTMVPIVMLMTVLFVITLIFHYFRLFRAGLYYLYLVSTMFVAVVGLMVGKGVNNFVVYIPIVLLSTILFKTRVERIIILLLTISIFFAQHFLFDIVPPQLGITPEVRATFSVLAFVLAMILTFLIGTYFIGINREYEGIIVNHKERLELKNKEVTDSINYAKRIQTAILPSQKIIREHLPDSFVLYKPKDIVAGDFYWMETAGDLVMFAVADCTGHGVPGAMVSVVCNNALNRSVREYGITDAGRILDKAAEIVVSEFEKSDEEVKDGMDISLCVMNKKTNELQWAGANNPLWLVREGALQEWRPDKQPVGKHAGRKSFTTHNLLLKKGDTFYIFSDGYHDQFGGEKGKKFKAAKMKELVLGIQRNSMQEQRAMIEETFESWKGNLEQVDDVCVMGVRM